MACSMMRTARDATAVARRSCARLFETGEGATVALAVEGLWAPGTSFAMCCSCPKRGFLIIDHACALA
jgi:hypothetical protein